MVSSKILQQGVQEDQGSRRVDHPHPILGVHSSQHPWLHSRNSLQRNTNKVHNPVESGTVEAFRQDPGGTDLGHGCSAATNQEKFQQFNKVQAQLWAEFQINGKGQKEASFANSPSNLGDTKQWNGKTYYWCPANHKYSHWHTHKVEECNTYKKMIKEQDKSNSDDKKKVTVDEDKLKKGMAAIFPSSDFNTDDLAEALAAAIAGIE